VKEKLGGQLKRRGYSSSAPADVLRIEADGIISIVDQLDDNFIQAVQNCWLECRGKVVVTGMGKSGLTAAKLPQPWLAPVRHLFFFTLATACTAISALVMKGRCDPGGLQQR